MKYNVGDKVIEESDIDLLFNPYWKDDYRKSLIKIVTEANEKYFSIYKPSGDRYKTAIEEGLSCGANQYMIFYQESGRTVNWASKTKLLHLEKDKELIVKMIEELGEKTFKENDKRLKDKIIYYKTERERLNKQYQEDLEINLKLISN